MTLQNEAAKITDKKAKRVLSNLLMITGNPASFQELCDLLKTNDWEKILNAGIILSDYGALLGFSVPDIIHNAITSLSSCKADSARWAWYLSFHNMIRMITTEHIKLSDTQIAPIIDQIIEDIERTGKLNLPVEPHPELSGTANPNLYSVSDHYALQLFSEGLNLLAGLYLHKFSRHLFRRPLPSLSEWQRVWLKKHVLLYTQNPPIREHVYWWAIIGVIFSGPLKELLNNKTKDNAAAKDTKRPSAL